MIQYDTTRHNTTRYDTTQYNTIQYNTIRYGTTRYGTLWYVTSRYDTIRHDTTWYNMIGSSKHNRKGGFGSLKFPWRTKWRCVWTFRELRGRSETFLVCPGWISAAGDDRGVVIKKSETERAGGATLLHSRWAVGPLRVRGDWLSFSLTLLFLLGLFPPYLLPSLPFYLRLPLPHL